MLNVAFSLLAVGFNIVGIGNMIYGNPVAGAIWIVGGALLTALMMIERKL